MKQNIDNVNLDFICNQKWDDMLDSSEGKFCSGCQKTVYDLTDKRTEYFVKLLAEHSQGFCGRFTIHQLLQAPVEEKNWKKWAIAAMIFIGFGSLTQKVAAQTVEEAGLKPVPVNRSHQQSFFLGKIAIPVMEKQTRAYLNALHDYLVKEFHGAPALNSTLVTSFNVNKDGKIYDIKTNRHGNSEANTIIKEIDSLLAKAPRWENYKETKEDMNRSYSLILSVYNGKITSAELF